MLSSLSSSHPQCHTANRGRLSNDASTIMELLFGLIFEHLNLKQALSTSTEKNSEETFLLDHIDNAGLNNDHYVLHSPLLSATCLYLFKVTILP
ncbi:hypothetical protein VNO77_12568 [Canavalia gladiata]|uniref:Uncharacterized protein n=1 Tax=Canavalia gladiata TaxID=3824 RepID=A0AAN9M1K4_CANGL